MTTSSEQLEQAMKSVVEAHKVLLRFHKELVAFWRIVDTQLAAGDHCTCLRPWNEGYCLGRSGEYKLKSPEEWTPHWLVRFYFDLSTSGKDSALKANTWKMAFVGIAANPDELSSFAMPECVMGIVDPGRKEQIHNPNELWTVARYGILKRLTRRDIKPAGWTQEVFSRDTNHVRAGGFWHASRVPLVRLTGEDEIRELVTGPLRAKYEEVFLRKGPAR